MLTDKAVSSLKPKEKTYRKFDGGGLHIEVRPNGAKYWCIKYFYDGKERRSSVGRYPGTRLSEAREALKEYKDWLKRGVDPKQATGKDSGHSFKHYAEEWLESQAAAWSPQHAKTVRYRIETFAYPTLRDKDVRFITAQDIIRIVDFVGQRATTAKRVLQYITRIFQRCVIRGICDSNPAYGITELVPNVPVKHNPFLSEKELPDFLYALDEYSGQPVICSAVWFLLLTFVRTSEMRFAVWEEFDLKKAEWRIPAKRMKMNRDHIVPLSKQALTILERMKAYSTEGLIFRMQRNPNKPISENAVLDVIYRLGYKDRVTGHGFRATASTILNEHGFNPDAIEYQLAHIGKDKVRMAYNHARYMEERQIIMQWWADFLDDLMK